jgi:hypothetical protein
VFVKVNTDAAYRAKFLKDPIEVLASEGITLSAKDQKELLEVIDAFRGSLPSLGELPRGYEATISAVQRRGHPEKVDGTKMLLP